MFGWDSFGSPETQDEEKPTPITVEVAGTICTGWSPLGKRAGADSENHVAFLAWIAHVRKSKPVLVIHECHKNFPSSILDNLLEDQYKLYHIVVDPKMIGHPVNRPDRMYTWCVRKDHVLRGSVEDFIEIFSASLVKNGDIFFCAPDGFKQQELQRLAKNRMCNVAAVDIKSCPDWSKFYPPGAVGRMFDHAARATRYLEPDVSGNSLILADLDQNPGYGPAASDMLPCLVTHGLIHNYSRKRCLVPAEHLVAQGLPVWHRVHGSELPFLKALGVLSSCDLKKLAGNGMYLPLIGYQLMYVLAYTTKKPKTFRSSSNASMASVPTLDGTPEYWRRLSGGDLLGE